MSSSSLAPPPHSQPGPSSSTSTSVSASASHSSHRQPTTISPETQRQIEATRTLIDSSLQNILLPSSHALELRAQSLHQNASSLSKQEDTLRKESKKLGKEGDKLMKVVGEGQRKIKELGNVQNWAEVLEREFMVLEEVGRLLDGGGSGSEDSWTGSESQWSEEGDADGDLDSREGGVKVGRDGDEEDGDGGVRLDGDENVDVDMDMDLNRNRKNTSNIPLSNTTNEDATMENTEHESPWKGKAIELETEDADHSEIPFDSSTTTNLSTTDPSSSSIRTSVSGNS